MARKTLFLLVCVATVAGMLLTACAPSATPAPAPAATEAPAQAAAPTKAPPPTAAPEPTAAPAPAEEPVTVRLIGYQQGQQAFWDWAFTEFNTRNPNITVEGEFVPTDQIGPVKTARLTTNDVEIVAGQPQDDMKIFDVVDAQHLDLTGQSFLSNFIPETIEWGDMQGKKFVMPMGIVPVHMVFYNKTEFDKLGLKAPTSWDEFAALCDEIKPTGVAPVILANGPVWPINMTVIGLEGTIVRAANPTFWQSDIYEGKAAFDGPEYTELFEKLETISGCWQEGALGEDYDNGPRLFAQGKGLMLLDGGWRAGDLDRMEIPFEVGTFILPGNNDAAKNNVYSAKMAYGFLVNKNAEQARLDAALKFLAFLADPEVYQRYITEAGYLPAQPDITNAGKITNTMNRYLATLARAIPVYEGFLAAGANYNLGTYTGDMFVGKITPAEAAEGMQKDWIESKPEWKFE